jgi:DNA ligase-associated metallophosphoesterase
LQLLPQRAVWCNETRSLFIADVHVGKTGHFRQAGIPIPQSVQHRDLERLQQLITTTAAHEVWILGDVVHDRPNSDWNGFTQLLSTLPQLQWHIILGNHDRKHAQALQHPNIQWHFEPTPWNGILLCHEPQPLTLPFLCGHGHPGVLLKGKGRQSQRVPAFIHWPFMLMLPAFTQFSGKGGGADAYRFAKVYGVHAQGVFPLQGN